MEALQALIAQKDQMEADITERLEKLKTMGVGMHSTLVDFGGFPRADVDVHAARILRHEVVCLQNDHRGMMAQIENALYELHAAAAAAKATAPTEQTESTTTPSAQAPAKVASAEPNALETKVAVARAFLKVEIVSEDSPASHAGLEVGDSIITFGSINADNFTSLSAVGQLTAHSEGRKVPLTIQRNDSTIHLTLTPRKWSGQGLLGCKVVAMA